MPNKIDFSFSDLIAGYITHFNVNQEGLGTFGIKTSEGKDFEAELTSTTHAQILNNLGEEHNDCTSEIHSMLIPERYIFVRGIFYSQKDLYVFQAQHIIFLSQKENEYVFEEQNWWIKQIRCLADFYLKAQFQDAEIEYQKFRTHLGFIGTKAESNRQESSTISRLIYGFSTAYLLTGDNCFLEAATKGTAYLREHMKFSDKSKDICYWYHAIDVQSDGSKKKIFASEFDDDCETIPAYEQIYTLAGLTQTYRVTGDPYIKDDIDSTINFFKRYFLDQTNQKGFFSHVDPVTLSPYSKSLGHNRARKNWNSIGDHAPAYLINLWLATGEKEYAHLLDTLFDLIEEHFFDYDCSPFIQERFHEDWLHDKVWGWQQNRAVVGHNLKIAWNMVRMYNMTSKEKYLVIAEKIAKDMPKVGCDLQRGGWYDILERIPKSEKEVHDFAWHNRKTWWQQEQAILAYLILAGTSRKPEYYRLACEASAFYNTWFLDRQTKSIYFSVLSNGIPYILGEDERKKGSHSMSGYHAFELAYLGTVYFNLLVKKKPIDLYFKPKPNGFKDGILRVMPDILPPKSVQLSKVWVDEQQYFDFDPENLTVKLPTLQSEIKVKVQIVPVQLNFSVTLIEIVDNTAIFSLSGILENHNVTIINDELQKVLTKPVNCIVLRLQNLKYISEDSLRYLIFQKQKLRHKVEISFTGAQDEVKEFLDMGNFEYVEMRE